MSFDDDEYERPSKSELKREADAIRKLGKTLAALPPGHLARIPLPDDARTAIKDAAKIRQNVAKKRHFQYIGKLLRKADVEAISDELERIEKGLPSLAAVEKKAEEAARPDPLAPWVKKLLDDGDTAIQSLIEEHPALERSRLRQLVRNALKKPGEDSKPMRMLRDYLGEFIQ